MGPSIDRVIRDMAYTPMFDVSNKVWFWVSDNLRRPVWSGVEFEVAMAVEDQMGQELWETGRDT